MQENIPREKMSLSHRLFELLNYDAMAAEAESRRIAALHADGVEPSAEPAEL